MKKKNNKGFTLIELLAVIVILAIVTVLAATSIIPFMRDAGKNSFAIEANGAIDAASDAVSLMSIGSIETPSNDDNFKKTGDTYCITLDWLVDRGVYDLDAKSLKSHTAGNGTYEGKIDITKSGNAYTYTLTMRNNDYFVTGAGTIDKGDPISASETPNSAKFTCE